MHGEPEFDELHVPARDLRVERCPLDRRRRRRGPRSLHALQRRARLRFTPPSGSGVIRTPPDGVPSVSFTQSSDLGLGDSPEICDFSVDPGLCELSAGACFSTNSNSGDKFSSSEPRHVHASFSERVRIWSVNVCKLSRRKAELEARLLNANVDILLLQETWLTDSEEEVRINGFYLVGRLDRTSGPKAGFGGVAIYAHTSLSNIALQLKSQDSERIWCILHTNIGAFLVGNWYRAPDTGDASVLSLSTELASLRGDVVGVILAGDVNVHHRKWLRHSSGNSALGERLWNISKGEGLKQLVSKPTRGDYLLDIVLSDAGDLVKANVLPSIADHRVVSIDIDVVVARTSQSSREVWDFHKAEWDALRHVLRNCQWSTFLCEDSFDMSINAFCGNLFDVCAKYNPKKVFKTKH